MTGNTSTHARARRRGCVLYFLDDRINTSKELVTRLTTAEVAEAVVVVVDLVFDRHHTA